MRADLKPRSGGKNMPTLLQRMHGQRGNPSGASGPTGVLHRPWLYDLFVKLLTLGRESRLRSAMLDHAPIKVGDRILDVGCGTGTLALGAKRRAGPTGTVAGIDASPEMIGRARTKAKREGLEVQFTVGSATSLPIANGSYDVVLCSLALHHVPKDEREAAIEEMHRALVPGGHVLILELAPESHGLGALSPIGFAHRHAGDIAKEAEMLISRTGFQDVQAGQLGFRSIKYVLGSKPALAL
jgi:SAM-dependent methyltransferase